MLDQKTISMIIDEVINHSKDAKKAYKFKVSDLFVGSIQSWIFTIGGILMLLAIAFAVVFAISRNPYFKLVSLMLESISILIIYGNIIYSLYQSIKPLSSPTETFLNTIEKSIEIDLKLFSALLKHSLEQLKFVAEKLKFEYEARAKVLSLMFGPLESIGFVPTVITILISAVNLNSVTSAHNAIFYSSLALCSINFAILMLSIHRELCLKRCYFLFQQAVSFKEASLAEAKVTQSLIE
jgi:ABC-type transport system involved in Fe-S cluster assembly fused permease/ATPase subunit